MTQLTDKMEGLRLKEGGAVTFKAIHFNQALDKCIALVKAEEAVVGNINNYPTYYQTVVASPQWLAWGKVAHQHGFDWDESVEIGVLSPKHFQAFLAWIISEAYKKGFIDGGLQNLPDRPLNSERE